MNCKCNWVEAIIAVVIILFAYVASSSSKWVIIVAALLLLLHSLMCKGCNCQSCEEPMVNKKNTKKGRR